MNDAIELVARIGSVYLILLIVGEAARLFLTISHFFTSRAAAKQLEQYIIEQQSKRKEEE